jgi:hypothetical protein
MVLFQILGSVSPGKILYNIVSAPTYSWDFIEEHFLNNWAKGPVVDRSEAFALILGEIPYRPIVEVTFQIIFQITFFKIYNIADEEIAPDFSDFQTAFLW